MRRLFHLSINQITMAGCLLLATAMGYAQETATGYVYVDANGNGKRDRNEAGLPNVGVSNIRDVVLTDENSPYTLPWSYGNICLVSKTDVYIIPFGAHELPKFYCRHNPTAA